MLNEYLNRLNADGITLEDAKEKIKYWEKYEPTSDQSYWLQEESLAFYKAVEAMWECFNRTGDTPIPPPTNAGKVVMDYIMDLNDYANRLNSI